MTDIEAKALALVNEVARERGSTHDNVLLDRAFIENEALMRAIEQLEAFRQEVSDAVMQAFPNTGLMPDCLGKLIIPKPKPDPLFDVLWELGMAENRAGVVFAANRINETLEARGFEIREKGQ